MPIRETVSVAPVCCAVSGFKEAGGVEYDKCIAFLKKNWLQMQKTLGSRLVALGPTQTAAVPARTRTLIPRVDESGVRLVCRG